MANSSKPEREPREFELKLEFDPADLAAIEAHPLLAGLRLDRQTLYSVYYDTPDLALYEARLSSARAQYWQRLCADHQGHERRGGAVRSPRMGTARSRGQRSGLGSRRRHAARTASESGRRRALAATVPDPHRARRLSRRQQRLGDRDCRRSRAIETTQRRAPVHEVELELKQRRSRRAVPPCAQPRRDRSRCGLRSRPRPSAATSLPRTQRPARRRQHGSISMRISPASRPSAPSRKTACGRSSSMSAACAPAMPSPCTRCASACGACARPSSHSKRSPPMQSKTGSRTS